MNGKLICRILRINDTISDACGRRSDGFFFCSFVPGLYGWLIGFGFLFFLYWNLAWLLFIRLTLERVEEND